MLSPRVLLSGVAAAGGVGSATYASIVDAAHPEYYIAATLGAVFLVFFLLKHEAERILGIIDRIPPTEWYEDVKVTMERIPQEEWFDRLRETLLKVDFKVGDHEARISYLEGLSGIVNPRRSVPVPPVDRG